MMTSMNDMDKEMNKRRAAMKSRLEKLGTDNPVVSQAVKMNTPKKNPEGFDIIEELVSAARKRFNEDSDLKACAASLAGALQKLSKTGGLDTNKVKVDNSNNSSGEENEGY